MNSKPLINKAAAKIIHKHISKIRKVYRLNRYSNLILAEIVMDLETLVDSWERID